VVRSVYQRCTAGITSWSNGVPRCTAGLSLWSTVYGSVRCTDGVRQDVRRCTVYGGVQQGCTEVQQCTEVYGSVRTVYGSQWYGVGSGISYSYLIRRLVSGWCLSARDSSPCSPVPGLHGITVSDAAKQPLRHRLRRCWSLPETSTCSSWLVVSGLRPPGLRPTA